MRVANQNKTRNLLNLQLSTFILDGYKIGERDSKSLKFPSRCHAGTIQRGGPGGPDPPPPPPPPSKYQTPSNLNTRTAHGPSTVRDGFRIAPDVFDRNPRKFFF